jgi:hypothetical protein
MIIHFYDEKEQHYLCNFACNTLPEKRTTDKEKVTCKNCLRALFNYQNKNSENYPKYLPKIDIPKLKKIVENLPQP